MKFLWWVGCFFLLGVSSLEAQLYPALKGCYPRHAEWFLGAPDWTHFQSIEISYTPSGDPAIIEYDQSGTRTRVLCFYNEQRLETERLYQDLVGAEWKNSRREVNKYTPLGHPEEILYEAWRDNAWVIVDGNHFIYVMDGDRIMTATGEVYVDFYWVVSSRKVYSYIGTDSHYVSITIEHPTGQTWVPEMKTDYTWNGDRWGQVFTSHYENGIWSFTGRTIYEWKENGSYVMTNFYHQDPDIWVPADRNTQDVDTHGNITLEQHEMAAGEGWSVVGFGKYKLTYEGDNLTQRIFMIYEWGEWVDYLKEEFSNFASLGTVPELIKGATFSIFPNPAGDQAWVRVSNLSTGTVSLSLVSVTGQTVLTEQVPVNGSDLLYQLNLSRLPGGTYIIMARDHLGHDIAKASLIKE